MIFTEKKITITNNQCNIDSPVILYRGDYNVEIRFTIISSPHKYSNKQDTNIVESTEASYGQLVIRRPNNTAIFSEIAATKRGAIIFTITAEMIDEITEVGNYTFQIRLLDENKESRATIPEVVNGIEIREPIATEDVTDTNEVGVATVGYAMTTEGTTEDAFDNEGNYNKTTWGTGDRITGSKLNKIEAAIDGVNKKVASGGTGGQGMTTEQAQQLSTAYQHSQSTHAPSNAEANVQSDWNITDTTSDAYIKNKPTNLVTTDQLPTVPTKTSQLTNDSNFVTSTQMADAINDAQLGGGTGAGISSTARTLLISILRKAVYTSDQSANIDALATALASSSSGGETETTQYTITNSLSNATSSNATVLVDANASYSATITVNDGYSLDSITVTMGGTDITSTAVSGTTITISEVTGNVVITVTTTESGSSSGGGMVTDGLVNYFDFRTAEYNNSGAGGSTIISATQGNGSLYTWAANQVTEQGDYGMKISRSMIYNGTSVGTTSTSIGTSFTIIFKCYLTAVSSPLFTGEYATLSNTSKLSYKPKYKTTSGTGTVTDTSLGTRVKTEYDTVTLIVDGNICKLYFGTTLMQTNDGGTISDFQRWYDVMSGIGILGGTNGYLTQMAVYNKALSEVELVDMIDYLSSLEVK